MFWVKEEEEENWSEEVPRKFLSLSPPLRLSLFFPSLLSFSFSMGKSQRALSDWSTQVSSRDRLIDAPPTARRAQNCTVRDSLYFVYISEDVWVDGLRAVGCGRPCCLNAHSRFIFCFTFLSPVWLTTQNHSTLVTERSAVPFLPVNPEYSATRNQVKTHVLVYVCNDWFKGTDGGEEKKTKWRFLIS